MIVKNVTDKDMQTALNLTNDLYDCNIKFNRYEPIGNRINFTLTVVSSKNKGSRYGFQLNKNGSHRKLAKACWHVHGDFFDSLFSINPEAEVVSMGKKINTNSGNWEDRNIGSQYQPYFYSEACDCGL